MKRARHLLDYMATHPDAKIRYKASDMVLNVHSDASYLSAPKARSRAGGYFFLGQKPRDNEPIWLNGAIDITVSGGASHVLRPRLEDYFDSLNLTDRVTFADGSSQTIELEVRQ